MKISLDQSVAIRRDPWMDACGLAAFLSFLLIVGDLACPWIVGGSMAYSGGGAVILGISATLCLGLNSASVRLASAIGLMGLMMLRALSPVRPDLFRAEHGSWSLVDAGGMVLLIAAATLMVCAATQGSSSGPDQRRGRPGHP